MGINLNDLQSVTRQAIGEMLTSDFRPDDPWKEPLRHPSCAINPRQSSPTLACASHGYWKILICDQYCRDIIALLFTLSELREFGVTLYLELHSPRQPVSQAPAAYFLLPTQKNVECVVEDVLCRKYAHFDLNMCGSTSEATLHFLSKQLSPLATIVHLTLRDWPLQFFPLESHLFSLESSPSMPPIKIQPGFTLPSFFVEEVCAGLKSLIQLLGVVPYISSFSAGPSRQLAEALAQDIHDTVNTYSSCSPLTLGARPVMLILDRCFDLITPLLEPFSYGGLLVDTLEMRLKKVRIEEKSLNPGQSDSISKNDPKSIQVSRQDKFWETYGRRSFSEVCEALETALAAFQVEKKNLTRSTEEDIKILLERAPQMAEEKRVLESHTTLSHAILEQVRRREIDKAHRVEKLIIQSIRERSKSLEGLAFKELDDLIISSHSDRTWEDRLRTLSLYALYVEQVHPAPSCLRKENTTNDLTRAFYFSYLQKACENLNALFPMKAKRTAAILAFLKENRTLPLVYETSERASLGKETSYSTWFDRVLSSAVHNIAKTFVPKHEKGLLPLTRLVEAVLMKDFDPQDQEKQSLLDLETSTPHYERQKLLEVLQTTDPLTTKNETLVKQPLTCCVVCILGGLTYEEYYNLREWNLEPNNAYKYVFLGGTEILTGKSFLHRISSL